MLLTAHKLLLRSSLTAAGPCLDSPAPLPGPGGHGPGSSSGQAVVKAGRLSPSLSAAILPTGTQTSDSQVLFGGAAALSDSSSAGALAPVCPPGGCPIPGEQNGRTVAPGHLELGLFQSKS